MAPGPAKAENEAPPSKDRDDILNQLPVNTIYNEFENVDNINNYSNFCKLTQTIKDKYTDFEKFEDLCKKFAYSLDRIFSNKYKGKNMEHCILLKYWIYDEIKKIFSAGDKLNVLFLTEELKKLQYNIQKEESVIFDCYDDYNDYMSNWEVERNLFEYFISFHKIKNKSNFSTEETDKYIKYVKYIKTIYDEKINKEHCCDLKYRHLYDHYFDCNPEYNPDNLLSKLNGESKKPNSEVQAREAKTKSLKQTGSGEDETEESDKYEIVIPNVPIGWNKRRYKQRTELYDVKCIMNYADRKNGYALVSCYNTGKKYPNAEYIFRPTKEEDAFFAKIKEEKKRGMGREATREGSQDSVPSKPGVTETSAEGRKNDGNSATPKPKIHVGIPEYLRGYSLLGEYIKERSNDTYGSYQPGREAAFTYSGSGRRFIPGVNETQVGWTYTKLENGKVKSVVEADVEKHVIPVNGGGQNEGTTSTITESPSTEWLDGSELTEVSMFKTPMFRGSTLAVLLVGIVFVFFIYYKVYDNYKMCVYIN
ncbi:hypothetical protein PVX_005055 [Plasmodium vivax]|uniref:VIR protein n=1 Tax=Plasmodium vivax (strain Salvador I) TaxID=126793 RepID=A5KE71_PLAVS|nr:hypothetical protein PVX_005055 [Plasmodium vivax]EDL42288.1 hypothetical protein PVX_005055 [Plasmodium vivax]|eukprot:XP_001608312.1 hypothetical protein [Plasmodium vivax Sal-1]